MKKSILLLALSLAAVAGQAQSRWGVRTGLNYDLAPIGLNEALATSQEIFEGENTESGYHIGVFGRQYLGDQLYLGSSLFYAKNSFLVRGTNALGVEDLSVLNQSNLQLDANVGLRLLKFVRAEGGVNYQMNTANSFSDTFEAGAAGYNLGVGVDLWKLSVDLTYYSSFNEHEGIWNNIPLSYNRSQMLLSLGVKL